MAAAWTSAGAHTGYMTGSWVGGTGVVPTQPACSGSSPGTAKRAPEAQRAGVGGTRAAGAPGEYGDGGGDGPETTLRARSVSLQEPSLSQDLADCRLSANKGEIQANYL